MINFLGGIVINDLNDIKNATHIIYNNNYYNNVENDINNFRSKDNKNLFYVDIKWIFDCFFQFKNAMKRRMNIKYRQIKKMKYNKDIYKNVLK